MDKTTSAKYGRITFVMVLTLLAMVLPAAAGELTARDIMEKNFFVGKLKTMKQSASMTLVNDRGESRERKVDFVGKLQPNGIDSNIIVRFQYPPDIKGTGFLQIERSDGHDNIWIYLPALHKSRRLVANNKKDSFFGSDFSYGDILLPKVELYQHKLLGSEVIDGHDCYVIESVPKNEAVRNDSGYSKTIIWVRKDNFLESKMEYHDIEGRLLKTQIVTQHKEVDSESHRWTALRREMTNHLTGHKTILIYSQTVVGQPVSDDFFTTRTIEREWHQ